MPTGSAPTWTSIAQSSPHSLAASVCRSGPPRGASAQDAEDVVDVRRRIDVLQHLRDVALGVDQDGRALVAALVRDGDTERVAELVRVVDEQRKRELVLPAELAVGVRVVGTDAEDLDPTAAELAVGVADPARLRRAPRRVVLGIEVEDDRLAAQLRELHGAAVVGLRVDIRCSRSFGDHCPHANRPPRDCVPGARRDVGRSARRRLDVPAAHLGERDRRAPARARADAARRAGRARAASPLRSPARAGASALPVRHTGARGCARAVALRAARPAPSARVVRRRYPGRRSARGAGVHDRNLMGFPRINPTLRGFLIVALIAIVVVVLQLESTLVALGILLRIAFILAITFFIYLMWRERRSEIATWSMRAQVTFYGAALLIVVDIGVNWYWGAPGLQLLAFLAVIVLCLFAMWRVWRDQHTYGI